MKTTSFAPIATLFAESWQLFTQKIKPLFLMQVLQVLITLVVSAVLVLVAIAFVAATGVGDLFSIGQDAELFYQEMAPQLIAGAGFLVIVVALVLMYLSAIFQAALLKVLESESGIVATLKASTKFGFPLLGLMLITSLLTMGGIFFFIVPGIILAILLPFATYELVLNGKSVMQSLYRSVQMTKTYFWQVAGRASLWVVLSIIFSLFIRSITEQAAPSGAILLFVWVLNYLFNLFGLAYFYRLYKQLNKAATDLAYQPQKWILVLGGAGWALLGLVLLILFQYS